MKGWETAKSSHRISSPTFITLWVCYKFHKLLYPFIGFPFHTFPPSPLLFLIISFCKHSKKTWAAMNMKHPDCLDTQLVFGDLIPSVNPSPLERQLSRIFPRFSQKESPGLLEISCVYMQWLEETNTFHILEKVAWSWWIISSQVFAFNWLVLNFNVLLIILGK